NIKHLSYLRLRIITERSLITPSSFAYCFSLIHQVIMKGGIDLHNEKANDLETSMEQIALGLDITSFHTVIGSSLLLPRSEMINTLLHIIKEYPKFTKVARTAMINLCESIGETAEQKEINVLLTGLLSPEPFVRHACLQALDNLDLTDIDFSCELWIGCHDEDEHNAKLAIALWESNGMDVEPSYNVELLPYLIHEEKYVRECAAKSIGNASKYFPDSVADTLSLIYEQYKEKAKPVQPEYDEFGILIPESLNKQDQWEARVGLALSLGTLAQNLRPTDLKPLFEFLINDEAIGDIHAQVRQKLLE
ncbi:31138_t:CDS:2, partial [Racocetra persica]